jgi:hypothetical protein
MQYWKQVRQNLKNVTEINELSSREEELYLPLKAIADVIDPNLFPALTPYILQRKGEKSEERLIHDVNLAILSYLKEEVAEGRGLSRLNVELCNEFNRNSGNNLTPKRFAQIVRDLRVIENHRTPHSKLQYDLKGEEVERRIQLINAKA